MNHWAQMLSDLPTLAQRTIARAQRISLPRGCSAEQRSRLLRRSLCHIDTVRQTYRWLEPDAQAALQDLRHRRAGVSAAALQASYGPLRTWSALAADPHPRSTSERLVLLGWLVPRPATPHHPLRYRVPPEVRAWLPQPLAIPTLGPAPLAPPPPILTAVAALLVHGIERPLALRADGRLRAAARRQMRARLPATPATELGALLDFALPLLQEQGLIDTHGRRLSTTVAGQRFLALEPDAQHERLLRAWVGSSTPDAWLRALVLSTAGIDWPLLRRRLCAWAACIPHGQLVAVSPLYQRLAAALGPLADARTHGFRTVRRAPWQPRRAAAVFGAALQGPLRWLGLVMALPATSGGQLVAGIARPAAGPRAPWRYGDDGTIGIPYSGLDRRVVELLPFARWLRADAEGWIYRVTRASLARGLRNGQPLERLWRALSAAAGPVPDGWRAAIEPPGATVRLEQGALLLVDPPELLERAMRARSVRRHLRARPAPGVALVAPDQVTALLRALDRHRMPVDSPGAGLPAPAEGGELAPGSAAALLVACRFYRRHAPPDAPLLPDGALERWLQARMTPALRAACDEAPSAPLADQQILPLLRAALGAGASVWLRYRSAGRGAWSERVVRPLALVEQDQHWYLRAWCFTRAAERTFRVERIVAARPEPPGAGSDDTPAAGAAMWLPDAVPA